MGKSNQSGVALVEFALLLPFLLLLSFITTEFGRALYEYQTVTKSVRDAVRYLSIQTEGSTTAQAEARNLVIYGYVSPSTGTPALAPGLVAATVSSSWQESGSAPTFTTVTVKVANYQFRSLFTTAFGLPFGTITYSDITATMRSHT